MPRTTNTFRPVFYESSSYQNDEKKYIKSYNYIPEKFYFHHTEDENTDQFYLGVELEVDDGGEDESKAKSICDILNCDGENIYCKHDGSLFKGFEIVTHPSTLKYHKKMKYEEAFLYLINNNYRSHDTKTCGLHVHINRSYFGVKKLEIDLNISKLLYLFEKYWDKIEQIARRPSNSYARRFMLEDDESPIDLYAKSKASDKYGAINLQHKDTVEIRIFRGTLNYNTFISTLEFVCVMARIAKETDIYEVQFITWNDISNMFSVKLSTYVSEREKVKISGSFTTGSIVYDVSSMRYATYSPDLVSAFSLVQTDTNEDQETEEQTEEADNSREEIEEIKRLIQNLRRSLRYCRNGLEERNINRELSQLETWLSRLRRSR